MRFLLPAHTFGSVVTRLSTGLANGGITLRESLTPDALQDSTERILISPRAWSSLRWRLLVRFLVFLAALAGSLAGWLAFFGHDLSPAILGLLFLEVLVLLLALVLLPLYIEMIHGPGRSPRAPRQTSGDDAVGKPSP